MKKLKSLIGPMLMLLVIVAGVLLIILYENEKPEEQVIKLNSYELETKEYTLENDKLKFVMDAETTQFSVTVKETGKQWFSNPVDAASDPLALTVEKGKLQSTLYVTYSNVGGVDALYNNYDYSISRGIYDIEAGEDYVKVLYSVGNTQKEFLIPPVCKEADFNALLANMDKKDATLVQDYYKKYDINKLGKKDNKEELLANYPVLAETVIYVLRDTTKDSLKSRFEEYFAGAGYTMDEYKRDCALDLSITVVDTPIFNVNVIYRLEDGDLKVEIPLNEMEYREDYPLYSLTVLPYFGAGGSTEEGFVLVPEGGGALLRFNNGKKTQNAYYANVYGWDMAQARSAVIHETETSFGVYGIAKEDASYLCLLEEGAPYAAIQADISGKKNSYNYANATYSIVHRELYELRDESQGNTYVYEKQLPDETLVQRYRFIDSDSYVDMAKAYQEYLLDRYDGYLTKREHTEAPAAVEIIGAVDKVKQVFGIPMSRPLKLTSFEEAQNLLEEIRTMGINNISVKLTGWMNGGVRQKILNKVSVLSDLGGKKELQSLIDYTKENDIPLYLNGITNYAMNSGLLNGFFSLTDAARKVSKERAELYDYMTVTYVEDTTEKPFYLLKAESILEKADILSNYAAGRQTGVSFEDIGDALSADYTRDNPFSRQKAMYMQQEKLKELFESGIGSMVKMGNDYAVPYCDMVTDMDLGGYPYTILDEKVPFYQMALHGYVDYTGESINLAQNEEEELLKSAEYGAGLKFTVMEETTFALQKTKYSEYFGADFEAFREQMQDIYTRYNTELGHIFNQKMTDHEYVTDTLTCTTYEDGTKVYVNYDYETGSAEGVTIPARDYMVIR